MDYSSPSDTELSIGEAAGEFIIVVIVVFFIVRNKMADPMVTLTAVATILLFLMDLVLP